jgi:hypothetical protein
MKIGVLVVTSPDVEMSPEVLTNSLLFVYFDIPLEHYNLDFTF